MVDPSGGTLTPIRDTSWSDRVRYQLRRGTTLIGRSAAADVCVNSTTVSRSHAQLDWTEQGLVLTQLSSTNLTLANGLAVTEPVALISGDVIEIGNGVSLRLDLFGATDEVATTPVSLARRQINAIFYADVVGYTMLTATDEAGAIVRLQAALAMIHTQARDDGGMIANVAGDGVLALYPSVMAALNSAISIQRVMKRVNAEISGTDPLEFRIGLNSGDIITTSGENGENVFGDSINGAARVQELAPPGGILLSGAVYDQLHGANTDHFDIKPRADAKSIDRRVRLYEVSLKP